MVSNTSQLQLERRRVIVEKAYDPSSHASPGQKVMKFKGSLPSLVLFLVVLIYLFGYVRFRTSSPFNDSPPKYAGSSSKSEEIKRSSEFFQNWISENEARLDWNRELRSCAQHTAWKPTKQWWFLQNRTDPESSYISLWDIRPSGQYSRFFIQSQLPGGHRKTIGGDSWRVHIQGPASLNPIINDFENGTYEVKFLAMEGGEYRASVFLDYTLCGGIVDPPHDWFIQGNVQGKEQQQGILGTDIPYMKRPLWNGEPVTIHIKDPDLKIEKERVNSACNLKTPSCDFIWNGLGRWVNKKWIPFCKGKRKLKKTTQRNGILWIFGDSTSEQFYYAVRSKPLCKKTFKYCSHSYNWIYQLANYNHTLRRFTRINSTFEKLKDDDLDWNLTRIIHELKQVLEHPDMTDGSVLLLNYGLHFVEVLNFTSYRQLIDAIIDLIKDTKTHRSEIIWRTTTAINRHKYSKPDLHSRRFLTQQRVRLYNAYANKAMCTAGISVLDWFPITNAYPDGTGSQKMPRDPVHYVPSVLKPIENLIQEIFS